MLDLIFGQAFTRIDVKTRPRSGSGCVECVPCGEGEVGLTSDGPPPFSTSVSLSIRGTGSALWTIYVHLLARQHAERPSTHFSTGAYAAEPGSVHCRARGNRGCWGGFRWHQIRSMLRLR